MKLISLAGVRRPLPLYLAALAFALTLTACSQDKNWKLLNLTGIMPPLEFNLHDQEGQAVTADKYLGKTVLLYFGYTHCPDVCPTTLVRVSHAVAALGKDADKVRVLFVSVDPARDTPPVMKQYVKAFGPHVLGLSGDEASLRRLTKRYRVTFGNGKKDGNGNYEVTHSSAVFVFDAKGETRLMARSDDSAEAITHDLKRLIGGA